VDKAFFLISKKGYRKEKRPVSGVQKIRSFSGAIYTLAWGGIQEFFSSGAKFFWVLLAVS
jgi:hypothetical protein